MQEKSDADAFAVPTELGDESQDLIPLVLSVIVRVAAGFSRRLEPDAEASELLRSVAHSVFDFVLKENERDRERLLRVIVPELAAVYRQPRPSGRNARTQKASKDKLTTDLLAVLDKHGLLLDRDELDTFVSEPPHIQTLEPRSRAVANASLLLKIMALRTYDDKAFQKSPFKAPKDATLETIRTAFGQRPSLAEQARYVLALLLNRPIPGFLFTGIEHLLEKEDNARRIHYTYDTRKAGIKAVGGPPSADKDGQGDRRLLAYQMLLNEARGLGRARIRTTASKAAGMFSSEPRSVLSREDAEAFAGESRKEINRVLRAQPKRREPTTSTRVKRRR